MRKTWFRFALLLAFILPGPVAAHELSLPQQPPDGIALQQPTCQGEFISVSKPLIDLGNEEYIRMDDGPTGFTGGLYPNGSNIRPPAHNAAGLAMAAQVVPRDAAGAPNPQGKIVLVSIGMSNTAGEFGTFERNARQDDSLNPHLVIANGAQGGMVATSWVDPEARAWQFVDELLAFKGVTPLQVQAVWVKLTNFDINELPEAMYKLQGDLETIAHNLIVHFPNLKLAYFSSRTRAYAYWEGANPEPGSFETGFAVKWMIEKQIIGDPSLNFSPQVGTVMAPYMAWGPYLWIDGLNPRSDGMIWTPEDLKADCVHPSDSGGKPKVAEQLMTFFKTDTTARTWFLANPPPAEEEQIYVPFIHAKVDYRPLARRDWRLHAE